MRQLFGIFTSWKEKSFSMAASQVNSAECLQHEDFARLGDQDEDFQAIAYTESKNLSAEYNHACHGMIFARSANILWEKFPKRGCVLMQMRFDGVLGFPGGMMDKGEDPVLALNREMAEEIGLQVSQHGFSEHDHIQTVVNEKKKLVLHFFTKEMSEEDFSALEKDILSAEEYGIEVMGAVRVPLYTMEDGLRGFPAFLANQFVGNSRSQLLLALAHSRLLTTEEIQAAVDSSCRFVEQNGHR